MGVESGYRLGRKFTPPSFPSGTRRDFFFFWGVLGTLFLSFPVLTPCLHRTSIFECSYGSYGP